MDSSTTWALPSGPTAARAARAHLADIAVGWAPAVLDVALLLVSELVTNAVRHGRPPLTLHVSDHTGTASPPDDRPDRAGSNDESATGRRPAAGAPEVRVAVHDHGLPEQVPSASAAPMPATSAEGGRGLPLLAGMSQSWGVDRDPSADRCTTDSNGAGPGKTIWFRLEHPST